MAQCDWPLVHCESENMHLARVQMPWMVTFFGILVVPLGLTHIVLVISQPVVVGAWCTFCLLAALIMAERSEGSHQRAVRKLGSLHRVTQRKH